MYKQVVIFLVAFAAVTHQQQAKELRAIALVSDPFAKNPVRGNVTFTQNPDGSVTVNARMTGMAKGEYGFHIHEKGDITGGCGSTGSHFNPENKAHGHPDDAERHVGDLGNIVFNDSQEAEYNRIDKQIALTGTHNILGRAVVLHSKDDDFGRSTHPDSRKTGNAGGRVACGVIGILDPTTPWPNKGPSLMSSMFLTIMAAGIIYFNNLFLK